jgi:hypothetical protein
MGDPLETILSQLQNVRRTGDHQWQARCPAHDDRHASLSVSRGEDGRALLHCHAGCANLSILRAMGLRFCDLFPDKRLPGSPLQARIVATYDYRDPDGTVLFQVVRMEPKDFRQRRSDGNGAWVWGLSAGQYVQGGDGDWRKARDDTPADAVKRMFSEVRRVLYRLPELAAADPAAWVFVVEGEKDANNVAALGLAATTCPGGATKWNKLASDSVLHGRKVAILPDKDAAGREHARQVAAALKGKAADLKVLELPGDGKDASDWIAAGGTGQELLRLMEAKDGASGAPGPPVRPVVLIDTEEHRVVCETIAALGSDPDLYQRGGVLVRVIRETQPDDGVIRPLGSPTIQAMPTANLRERMTRCASFVKPGSKGQPVPAHPAPWLVAAVDARADWPGIRRLSGVSDSPVLRSDGSLWQTTGYDARTGVLYEGSLAFPPVHPEVGIDDAVAALDELLEVVCDFRFEAEEHKAAWLAGLLTPLARFAYEGPSPLFLIDANVRGAGKGLLAQAIGQTVLGREMPVSSYAHESEEMRKRITAIAIAGDRMVLLDNLEGAFGNDALDRALTSTRWKDRILGKSEEVDLPLLATWYATGNNVAVAADTTRRVIHVRLDVLEERPEERTGFRHPSLLGWVGDNRGKLMSAAMTILSAYCKAGRPSQGLAPFGSFEGWSDVVRQAVVWVGLPDPCLTRVKLAESADTTTDSLSQLVGAWKLYDSLNTGVVVSEMLARLYPTDRQFIPKDAGAVAMRTALENLVGCPPGRAPTPRQVGNRLKQFRRRVLDGAFLDSNPAEYSRAGAVWRLCDASNG